MQPEIIKEYRESYLETINEAVMPQVKEDGYGFYGTIKKALKDKKTPNPDKLAMKWYQRAISVLMSENPLTDTSVIKAKYLELFRKFLDSAEGRQLADVTLDYNFDIRKALFKSYGKSLGKLKVVLQKVLKWDER